MACSETSFSFGSHLMDIQRTGECSHVQNCSKCFITAAQCQILEAQIVLMHDKIEALQHMINNLLGSEIMLRQGKRNHVEVGVQVMMEDTSDDSRVLYDGQFVIPNNDPDCEIINSTELNPWNTDFYENITPGASTAQSVCDEDDSNLCTPITIHNDSPFSRFCVDRLDNETRFSHKFKNREAVYYGQYPYEYNGGVHDTQNVPDGSYLHHIMSYVDVVLPDFQYNSALVHRYCDGSSFIPAHSDMENCIEEGSDIVTISLGATRTMCITKATTGEEVLTLDLRHGDMVIMSKESQQFFKHEILPEPKCNAKRISITFRLIKTSMVEHDVSDVETNCSGYVPFGTLPPTQHTNTTPVEDVWSNISSHVPYQKPPPHQYNRRRNPPPPSQYHKSSAKQPHPPSRNTADQPRLSPTRQPQLSRQPSSTQQPLSARHTPNTQRTALYISSSMFRYLDEEKLSTAQIKAKKFFYPGADATIMQRKLKSDDDFLSVNPDTVSSLYIMCGTNNVNSVYYGSDSLHKAASATTSLLWYLKSRFPGSQVHVMNILPRATDGRNDVVRELNLKIQKFCKDYSNFTFMDTRHLFSKQNGMRNWRYFMNSTATISDNCHLNSFGVVRLGKYLKYWSHQL